MGMDRRQFLRRAGTGVAVVAFVPASRLWSADPAPVGAVAVPPLYGELILAGSVLDEAADDFGHLVSRQPYAVLRPGSVEDVAKMVRFVREQGLHIAGMGAVGDSHSTFGQAQVAAGVVIDMATLRSIGPVGPDGVWVEAGASWLDTKRSGSNEVSRQGRADRWNKVPLVVLWHAPAIGFTMVLLGHLRCLLIQRFDRRAA